MIRLEIDGNVASIILARAEARNALSVEMGVAFERTVDELDARDDVRAIIVRGQGKCFSAGGDLAMLEARAGASESENRRAMLRFYNYFLSVRSLRAPTIAVIHGTTMGAGVCLALACDLRVMASDASVGLNFVRIGLHPGMGATYFLPRIVGPARAAELLLTGKTIDAESALAIGLVNEVHPAAEVVARAKKLADAVAANAPVAVRHTKRTLVTHAGASLEQVLDAEAAAQSIEYKSEDLREGVASAREHRAPVFRGK